MTELEKQKLRDNVPRELRDLKQWVARRGKLPVNPMNGKLASATDPATWGDFEMTLATENSDGVGFVFTAENGLIGIDLDTVRNPETGRTDPAAKEIIKTIGSYTELSPSGYGFHIIARVKNAKLSWHKAELPDNGIVRVDTDPQTGEVRLDAEGNTRYKKPEVEMYSNARYFTVTGRALKGCTQLREVDAEVIAKLQKRFASEKPENKAQMTLENVTKAKKTAPVNVMADKDYLSIGLEKDRTLQTIWNGARPNGNESSDDLALMSKLAYWTNRDKSAMLEAFVRSPHCQTKDEKHRRKALERADYLDRTADKAIAGCGRTAAEEDCSAQRRQSAPVKAENNLPREKQKENADPQIGNSGASLIDYIHPLTDFQEKEAEWLIPGWLPRGEITLLASDGGVGKSSVTCEIAAALSRGKACLLDEEGTVREPQSVLILNAEDSVETQLLGKIRQLGGDLSRIFALDVSTGKSMSSIKIGSTDMADIIRHLKPALCILDPLQAFLSADVNMAARNAMRNYLEPLHELGMETGCTFLIVCHSNKRKGASGRDRLADSADLWDMARAIIMAGYTSENDTRYLSHEKSSYAGQMETVLFTVENGLPVVTGYSNLRDADYVQQRAWRDTPEEKPNAELLNALVELADPAGEKKHPYNELTGKYGEEIWGGKQPGRAISRLRKLLEEKGFSVRINVQVRTNERNQKGFAISPIKG